jgi:hypothetical protein
MAKRWGGSGWPRQIGQAALLAAVALAAQGCAETMSPCADGACRADGAHGDAAEPAPRGDAGLGQDAAQPVVDASRAPASGAGGTSGAAAGSAGSTPAVAGGTAEPACETWYRCHEACQGLALVGGGRALQNCTGAECVFELHFEPQIAPGAAECRAMSVRFAARGMAMGSVPRELRTELDERAWERLATIARALDLDALRPTECLECESRDTALLTLQRPEEQPQQLFYPLGVPPPAAREADEFVQMLIDELWASCNSVAGEDPCADDVGACRIVYANTQRGTEQACKIDPMDPSPCMTALECLCGGDVLPPSGDSLEQCIAWWLTPRDAPTLTDFCTHSAPSATRTLTDALNAFAMSYDSHVTHTGQCWSIRANY